MGKVFKKILDFMAKIFKKVVVKPVEFLAKNVFGGSDKISKNSSGNNRSFGAKGELDELRVQKDNLDPEVDGAKIEALEQQIAKLEKDVVVEGVPDAKIAGPEEGLTDEDIAKVDEPEAEELADEGKIEDKDIAVFVQGSPNAEVEKAALDYVEVPEGEMTVQQAVALRQKLQEDAEVGVEYSEERRAKILQDLKKDPELTREAVKDYYEKGNDEKYKRAFESGEEPTTTEAVADAMFSATKIVVPVVGSVADAVEFLDKSITAGGKVEESSLGETEEAAMDKLREIDNQGGANVEDALEHQEVAASVDETEERQPEQEPKQKPKVVAAPSPSMSGK